MSKSVCNSGKILKKFCHVWLGFELENIGQRDFLDLTDEDLGVNFTNVLRAGFVHTDSKNTKKHCWRDCLFALLGSLHIKALSKNVDEIDTFS